MSEIPYGLCHCGCGEKTRVRSGGPVRYRHGHNRRKTPYDYLVEDRGYTTPCWIWQRYINDAGYGKVGSGPRAHREYYKRFVGPIPDGLFLDHLCRVRACVNPAHLEPVTNGENVRRGVVARPPRVADADLSEFGRLVRGVRVSLAITQRELAGLVGVSAGCIGKWELDLVVPGDAMERRVRRELAALAQADGL